MSEKLTFSVRPSRIEDIASAVSIQNEYDPSHQYNYANNFYYPGQCVNFVAETEDKVVGFISALISPADMSQPYLWQRMRIYLAFIGVYEKFRGNGIGEVLIRKAGREAFVRTGLEHIYLECELNSKAIPLYKRINFIELTDAEVMERFGRPRHRNKAGNPHLVFTAKREDFIPEL